eukprot:6857183-Ditylum_brightwellii.AAC.1
MNDVPASDVMVIADITPDTDNDHRDHVSTNSWQRLMLKKEQFTWTKGDGSKVYDRPSLIWVILMSLKLTQNVGVQAEINVINNAKLASFGNDPGKMLDEMEMKFNLIQDVSQES